MTKAERLLYLIDLMHSSKGVKIEEICGRCRVSQRTIYRDLRSLGRLNYPVEFNQGYRLARGVPRASQITPTEIRLIRLCLRTSRAAASVKLRPLLRAIDRKLASSDGGRPVEPSGKSELQSTGFRYLELPRSRKLLESRLNALLGARIIPQL